MNSLYFQTQTRWLVTVILLFALSISNAWADYNIEFKTASQDESSAKTNSYELVTSETNSYVTSTNNSCSNCYIGQYGAKLAKSRGAGSMDLNLSSSGQIKATKITIKDALYYSTDNTTLSYRITYTDGTTTPADANGSLSLTSSAKDYEVSLTSTKTIQKISFSTASGKRAYIGSILVSAAASCSNKVTLTKVAPENGSFN